MPDYNLGTARGVIQIDYSGRGADQASNALGNISNNASRASDSVKSAGLKMAGAGALIAGGFALAIKSAAEFEKELSAIKAVSGATAPQMEQVRQKALQLGKDTKFSAAEGAQAIQELVKAGISVADVMNGAADATVSLAAAGEIDLATAATIASNAMNQFKLSAQELPHVADILAGAANASAIGVTDLGESLSYVGPVAKAVGVNIEDTATAIAILGNNGIKGSSAGTALRSILSNLVPTTKKATAEFKKLGLITEQGTNLFVDANGAIKPLDQVVQILNDHTAQLSKTEKNTFAKKSFGLETLSSVSILANETAASFDEMTAAIAKVKAADAAATRMDNLQGSIEQLKGSFETLMIVVGTPFLNSVRKIVDLLNVLTGAFLALPGPVRELAGLIGAFSGAALLAVGGLIVITKQVQAFRTEMAALANSQLFISIRSRLIGLIALMGPAGPWVVAFAAAGAAIAALFLLHKQGKRPIEDLTQAIKDDSDALGANTRAAIANRLQKQGALDIADKLGLNLKDVTDAVIGEGNAYDTLTARLTANKAALQARLDQVILAIANGGQYDQALQDEEQSLDRQISSYDSLSGKLKDNIGDLSRARASNDQVARAAADATTATSAQAAAIDDQLNRALGIQGAKAREAAGGTNKLTQDVKLVGAAADDTEKKITDLNNAIKALFDIAFGTGRALDNFHSKLNSLNEQVKNNGTSIKGFSDKAISNREALRTAAEAIGDYASELLKAGEEPNVVARKVENMRQSLLDQASAAGFSRKEVRDLTDVLTDIPDTIATRIDVNTDAGREAIVRLQQQIENVQGKTVRINVVGGIGALEHAVPGAATGAIVNKPTLLVAGEGRSAEAITPLPDLAAGFLRVYQAGQVAGGVRTMASSGVGRQATAKPSPKASRLVQGKLSIDRDSQAWFTGVAQDVYDGEDDFAGAYGRMG